MLSLRSIHRYCLILMLPLIISVPAGAARVELDLSGTWQYQKVAELSYPPSNNWQTVSVPGYLNGWQYERAWFRKTFTLPQVAAGTGLKLHFGGVKFASHVWVNGVSIGTYLNGYEPFEFDFTQAALPGQTNELIVGLTDWTGTFSQTVDFSNLAPYENARDHAKNALLAPIGGYYNLYGIWQPVTVLCLPPVSIADLFVMPSVRSNQLAVTLTLRNESATDQSATVANRVLDGTTPVFSIPGAQLTVPAGTATNLTWVVPWTNAILWSHLNPHLYTLESSVQSAAGNDLVNARFGFRELWRSGSQFILNGTPVNLLGAATWPPNYLATTAEVRKVFQDVKACNTIAMRLHTQPWDEKWYDIADEEGLLIIEEGAVWCDAYSYRLGDPQFWTNYAQHLSAAIKRDRNHPSIVLWSLENELLSVGGFQANSNSVTQLASMGRLVHAIDPTRMITYESDLDPAGAADVLGLHYPHEFPDFQTWPNTAYWMSQPIDRSWMPGGTWKWDQSKPLYIGEFLWVPGTSASVFSILFGDDAYIDPAFYRNQAKAITWRMQIEAYRASGVSGMAPWTMFEDPAFVYDTFDLNPLTNTLYQAQKAGYEPNAVFLDQYTPRFFTGQTVNRTATVYNDRMTTANLQVNWTAGNAPLQSLPVALNPAAHQHITLPVTAPNTPGSFALRLSVTDGANIVYSNSIACSASPQTPLSLPASKHTALFDPKGTVAALFNRFQLPFTTITNLRSADYKQFDLLVIGRNALTNDPVAEAGSTLQSSWEDFMRDGGWVLVLEQTNYPAWMPTSPQIDLYDATYGFPNPEHPVAQGIDPESLRWWAGDHRVVAQSLRTPARGNFRVIASVGGVNGLDHAAALEIPIGTGGMLCSQWLLCERFDLEPMAGVLLQRMLNYCAQPKKSAPVRPVAILSETNSAASSRLFELGLRAENVFGNPSLCDPAVYPLLIVAGGTATWQQAKGALTQLTTYVNSGGTLVLHRPAADFLAAAQSTLFPNLDPVDASVSLALRRDLTNAALHPKNDDLYWITQPGSWDRPEILSTNLATRTYRKRFDLSAYTTIQVQSMPVHTTGSASSGGWWLYANGYVAQNINVPATGSYLFSVSASGTPASGGWPQITLKIDGRTADIVTVTNTQLGSYTLSADLTAGTHQLALAFENDAWAPPEDRNLFLATIRYGLDTSKSGTTLLTSPGILAQVPRTNGLIILDEVRWEDESANATKAGRYIGRMLTELGAELLAGGSLRIQAITMSNVNIAAYSSSGGIANVYSNGRIQIPIRFSTSGTYTFQFRASGTPLQNVYPQVSLLVDNATVKTISVNSPTFQVYTITANVNAGTHNISLSFINDASSSTEDRNVAFDFLTITPARPLRISEFRLEADGSASLVWESDLNSSYEVQYCDDLAPLLWTSAASTFSTGTATSWRDASQSDSPQRFYRIKRTVP